MLFAFFAQPAVPLVTNISSKAYMVAYLRHDVITFDFLKV
jgi:hypothetical protein